MSREMNGMRSRRRKIKQIPPHCPQDSNLNSRPQGQLIKSKEFRTLLTVGLTSHNWPVYLNNCMQAAVQSIQWASTETFTAHNKEMSLFKWLMLIAAISLTESLIIFKGRSQQISTLPQISTNNTTKTNNEESSLQLPRIKRQTEETLKKFINITMLFS